MREDKVWVQCYMGFLKLQPLLPDIPSNSSPFREDTSDSLLDYLSGAS